MNSFDMNDDIRFLLPDDYIHETGVNDDGVLMTAIRADETTDDEGNFSYGFDARARLFEHDPDDFEKGFSSDRLLDVSMENLETARYITISQNPAANLINKKLSFSVFGIELHFNSIMCVIHADEWDVISLTVSKKNTGDPDDLIRAVERLIEVAKAIRIKGKPIPFESFDVASAVDALDYDDDLIDGIEDVTSEVIREARSTSSVKSFKAAKPNDSLYPHYKQLKGKTGPIAPGITMITNATGTEYEFIPLSRAIDNDELPEDERAAYQRVIEKDTATYDLADRVPEMQRLFHVNASVFNEKRDRECEIDQGLLHRAYMMSALRSFAWTLAEYCESNSTKPDNVSISKLKEIVAFCAKKEWLNYRGDSYCSGLCGCSDLHVFYIPDAVSKADRKKLLPSDELIRETERRKAALPYYNPILDEVHSLDALRKDLAYIYLAIHALFDSLAQNRNYDEALTGNEADIVYAWCSLAKAAKEPFYVEDGPMHCYFTQIENEEETAARMEAQWIQWEAEREQNAERNKEEWLSNYGHAAEKDPEIQFDGKLFVFSGVYSDEIIDAVMKRGGQKRAQISGITNYLVVDPRYCGESKTYNAIEQQKKGKPVKIILLDDLKAVLEGKIPTPKQPVSKPLLQTKTTTASTSNTPRKTISAGFPKGTRVYPGDDLEVFAGTVTEYKGTERDIILPAGITEIGADVFQFSPLRSIVVPEGVTKIGKDAFYSCEELTHVALPNSLKEIGEWSFHGCSKLEYIDLPDGLSEIGKHAFYESGLKEVHIPKSCKILQYGSFQNCLELKNVTLHDELEEIGAFAFSDCPKLKEVYVPSDTKIGALAFDKECRIQKDKNAAVKSKRGNTEEQTTNDTSLTSKKSVSASEVSKITQGKGKQIVDRNSPKILQEGFATDGNEAVFPDGVLVPLTELKIVDGALKQCKSKETDIILPKGIRSIAGNCFRENLNIRSVVIPEGVERIGDNAFEKAENLEYVYLPSTVRLLSRAAFYKCKKLHDINLPNSITHIGVAAFADCESLRTVVIPDGVKHLYHSVFSDCTRLKDVFVPASVKDFGYESANPFSTGNKQTKVHVINGSKAEEHCKRNRIPYNNLKLEDVLKKQRKAVAATKDNNPHAKESIDDKGQTVQTERNKIDSEKRTEVGSPFPDAILVPESDMKKKDTKLKKYLGSAQDIILPNGLTDVGNTCFSRNKTLRSVVIPFGVKHIGESAFYQCQNLEYVSLPSSIETIDANAFLMCSALKEIHIPKNVKEIKTATFKDCAELTYVIIPEGVESIEADAFDHAWNLMDVFLPSSLQKIAYNAFNTYNDDMLFHVNKGSYAERFCETSYLRSLYDYQSPEGFKPRSPRPVTEVSDEKDFVVKNNELKRYVGRAETVIIPDSVVRIGSGAFCGNKAIKTIEFHERIENIDPYAFVYCNHMETLVLPDSVQTMPYLTGLDSLKILCLSYAIKEITDDYTFAPCDALRHLYLPPTVTVINDSVSRFISKKATVHVIRGSFADQYALSHGLKVDYNIGDFWKIPLAKDAEEARKREEEERNNQTYRTLLEKMQTAQTFEEWTILADDFKRLGNYNDASDKAQLCYNKALEIQKRIEEERQKELARRAKEERRKALEAEKKEQEAIIQQNKGLSALFGEKAKKRKTAQQRIEEIARELEKL